MTDAQIIEVVAAHMQGCEVECIYKNEKWDTWSSAGPTWDFTTFDYRIKPEPPKPREFWIVSRPSGDLVVYDCRQHGFENIHVREVLE